MENHNHQSQKKESYRPLIIIITLITLAVVAVGISDVFQGTFSWELSMQHFMAGFFLVFSGFKLLDLPGFVQGYSQYDLLAMRVRKYGYVYPFLELGLGLLYLTGTVSPAVNIFTFLLMTFSGIGVARKIAKREKFTCACLGTLLNVPLTKITLVEDFGMAAMALLMLI
ncbi:MAG TPA: hypothetical protein PLD54_01630 [Candidatus Levybacteria bacterium]|nr:hypothetical protein [Candidatus Levybacteria bacterium]